MNPAQPSEHTFLFADLAGFTALTEVHGDAEAADLAAGFFDDARALLAQHGAEEVKTLGDALMIRCDEARDAIALGVRIVREVGARHGFPSVRVGLHTGPASSATATGSARRSTSPPGSPPSPPVAR